MRRHSTVDLAERDRESYYGSLFIHVGVIFQERLPGSALVIAAPLISIRYGNALWKSKEFEIWMFKWPSLLWSLRGVTDAARTIVCKAEPWRRTRILLFYRAKGTYSLTEYRRWIKPRTTSLRGRLYAALTALVPGSVANAIALFYCRLFHRGSGLILRDVMNSRYYFGNWFNASADPENPKALITGVTGQDGSYLADLLLDKGYRVLASSGRGAAKPRANRSSAGSDI